MRSCATISPVDSHRGPWWQFTKEFAPRLPEGTERQLSLFTPPPELAPGWRRAAVVLIPSTSLSEPTEVPRAKSRSFTSPADFNEQLTRWLVAANGRTHRSLGCRPIDRWAADAAAMVALPPTPPSVGWATTVRLGRDHYVRLDANDYSVHPSAIGRKVTVTADLNIVRIHCDTTYLAIAANGIPRGLRRRST
ncbi:MAG: hypothetical protein QOF31_4777 [Mycobacterium sp.]|jgi:hypothetical protein|nr:hypothetical protein [Mycobacterium sp.]